MCSFFSGHHSKIFTLEQLGLGAPETPKGTMNRYFVVMHSPWILVVVEKTLSANFRCSKIAREIIYRNLTDGSAGFLGTTLLCAFSSNQLICSKEHQMRLLLCQWLKVGLGVFKWLRKKLGKVRKKLRLPCWLMCSGQAICNYLFAVSQIAGLIYQHNISWITQLFLLSCKEGKWDSLILVFCS